MKFTSLLAREQLNIPNVRGPWAAPAARKPATVRSSASSHDARRRSDDLLSRTRGCVRRT